MIVDIAELSWTVTVASFPWFANCVLYVVADTVAGLSRYIVEMVPMLAAMLFDATA